MVKKKIENLIKKNLENVDLKLYTHDNKHFNAIIISDTFKNKTLVERQKCIYKILNELIINGKIHALSFKTYTKCEWVKENKN